MLMTVVIIIVFVGVVYFLRIAFLQPGGQDNEPTMSDMPLHPPISPQAEQVVSAGQTAQGSTFQGEVLAGNSALLLSFNENDYEKALNSDKLVVLYFYASWCPICKEEVASALYPAFNELEGEDVIGFRVNFNDNDTDQNEKELARQFGVAYQHTKVFLENGQRILKSPESWDKERYFEEINKALIN